MLSTLPPEIVYLIATYLPTASALAHLAQTCRRLHAIVASEDWRIFQAFVKNRFPNVSAPPYWRDVAQALTSRSRALDKHAVIGRFVLRPRDAYVIGPHQAARPDNQTLGFRPAMDSYETWNGSNWLDRKEVLAWGAAHELVLRVSQFGSRTDQTLLVFNDREHVRIQDDIHGVHLLKPEHPGKTPDGEHLILSRMHGDPIHIAISPNERTYEHRQSFKTPGWEIERTDLDNGPDQILATHFRNGTVSFYHTTTGETEVHPFASIEIHLGSAVRHQSTKFISPGQFAVGHGKSEDAISIWTISQERISMTRKLSLGFLNLGPQNGSTGRGIVTAIAPLNTRTIGGSPGDTFLAAWDDGAVRLHDLRSDKPYQMTYRDSMDQNPVYCVHQFGHDRFIAGAGGDAVLKIFDLRMPNRYSYREARAKSISSNSIPSSSPGSRAKRSQRSYPSKDFSIFVNHPHPSSQRARSRVDRLGYGGPIYAMSSPSFLSPTVYIARAGGVMRLDFASTDDLTGPYGRWYGEPLGLNWREPHARANADAILPLKGYERPDSRDTTTCSRLRSQRLFDELVDENFAQEQETGWDRRWDPLEEPGSWRRRD